MGKNQLWGRLGKGGRRQGAAGFGIWGTNQSWPGRKGKGVGGKAPGGKKGGLSRLECLLALRRVPPLSAMTSSDCMPQWSPHRVTQGAHSGAKERSPLGLRRVGGGSCGQGRRVSSPRELQGVLTRCQRPRAQRPWRDTARRPRLGTVPGRGARREEERAVLRKHE